VWIFGAYGGLATTVVLGARAFSRSALVRDGKRTGASEGPSDPATANAKANEDANAKTNENASESVILVFVFPPFHSVSYSFWRKHPNSKAPPNHFKS
jgi:hypothetical protein